MLSLLLIQVSMETFGRSICRCSRVTTALRMLSVDVRNITDVAVIQHEAGIGLSGLSVSAGLDKVVVEVFPFVIEVTTDHDDAAGRVDVHLEPSFGCDDAVVIVVVEVGDVVSLFVVETQFFERDGDFAGRSVGSSVEKDDCVRVSSLGNGHNRSGPNFDAFLL